MMISISKSRINTMLHCEQQFDFIYNQRLSNDETYEMSNGTIFHEWSAEFDRKLIELKNEKTIKEYIEMLLKNPTRTEWEKYYLNVRKDFLQTCIDEKKNWQDYFHATHIEILFEKEIDGNMYRSVCDRIYRTFSDELMLLELKTGTADLVSTRKELAISKIVIDNALNCDIKWFGLLNPNFQILQTEKVKKATFTSAKKSIVKFIDIINSGVYKKNKYFCGNCQFSDRCWDFTMFK